MESKSSNNNYSSKKVNWLEKISVLLVTAVETSSENKSSHWSERNFEHGALGSFSNNYIDGNKKLKHKFNSARACFIFILSTLMTSAN